MRLVLVGPPGSGKGTQARLLTERLGLRYLATGDALREAVRGDTPTGRAAKPYLDAGQLVPDTMVNQIVEEIFRGGDRPERFVLDGYPRTLAQGLWFDRLLGDVGSRLDSALLFVIDDDEVVRRLCGRVTCSNPKCGAVYHAASCPPKRADACDTCDSPLSQRDDDCDHTVRRRLRVYHDNTAGLAAHYRAAGLLREVPTGGPVESVYQNIIARLKPQG